MIHELILENVRSWKGRTSFQLKPLTLLYGPNGAGKSSFLNGLLAMRQTLEHAHGAELWLKTRGRHVDLGSFENTIFNRDVAQPLSLGIELVRNPLESSLRVMLEARLEPNDKQKRGRITDITLEFEGHKVVFKADGPRGYRLQEEAGEDFLHLASRRAGGSSAADTPLAGLDPELHAELFSRIYERHRFHLSDGLPGEAIQTDLSEAEKPHATMDEVAPDLDEAIDPPSSEVYVPTALVSDPELTPEQENAIQSTLHLLLMGWRLLAQKLGKALLEQLGAIRHTGPIRRAPKRGAPEIPEDGRKNDVGPEGIYTEYVLREEHVRIATNEALKTIEEKDHFVIQPPRTSPQDAESEAPVEPIRLKRMNKGRELTLPDIGYGLTQILPILVQLCADTDLVHVLEQPEVHLTPALQYRLTWVIRRTFMENHDDAQVFIETHSRDLILGVFQNRYMDLKRVRMLEIAPPKTNRRNEPVGSTYQERSLPQALWALGTGYESMYKPEPDPDDHWTESVV